MRAIEMCPLNAALLAVVVAVLRTLLDVGMEKLNEALLFAVAVGAALTLITWRRSMRLTLLREMAHDPDPVMTALTAAAIWSGWLAWDARSAWALVGAVLLIGWAAAVSRWFDPRYDGSVLRPVASPLWRTSSLAAAMMWMVTGLAAVAARDGGWWYVIVMGQVGALVCTWLWSVKRQQVFAAARLRNKVRPGDRDMGE